ncbi:ASCH domain-containing protein [Candidatus Pacearchaeota archaeon]|nr:ASCH domain-containing protein [Candidatus Pacearchaeota archaeon]
MSFMLTTEQVRKKTKTVTRRLGWWFLKPGDILNACVKCMGLKKGEKVEKICQIRVIESFPESLWLIPEEDCVKEGFPEMEPEDFIMMFCKEMKCVPSEVVNRIEFEYI